MEEEKIYQTEFCTLYWNEAMRSVREDWRIANCPFHEFQSMLYFMLYFCVENKVRNLIIDAFGAISILPEKHHLWLGEKFNQEFTDKTEIDTIFLIVPESLVTSISVNKYYESIKRNDRNVTVIKLKKLQDAFNILKLKMEPNS
jgi:hypothetical protein